jgi:hypothetical protein
MSGLMRAITEWPLLAKAAATERHLLMFPLYDLAVFVGDFKIAFDH